MSDEQNTTAAAAAPQETVSQLAHVASSVAVAGAGESLACQWQGCGERCPTAEALYEHVCERHVGRKSTNNLNLTCAWGQCRTTTVKRDHITSHIRVHVPLKPHKCEFCGKAFKRPQDLKKHVKTHADDSVIMRSPEPNGAGRGVQNGIAQGWSLQTSYSDAWSLTEAVSQGYYGPAIPPHDYGSAHHQNPYYQPPQTGQHPGYGPVTYYPPAPQATYDFETRKRGYDALDHFFGQVKRREVDPINYHSVSRRLFELQGLQLPQIIPSSMSVPAYQPVAVGGAYDAADPIQSYSLPPMGNAKTRGDLTSIDQILEQMQATIYENDTHLAQAGVAQSGGGYTAYRTSSNSPPSQLPTSNHAAGQSMMQHSHHGSVSGSTAETASTPGLTPPSSAQSYTSGQSPLQGHSAPSGAAMYPSLPSQGSDIAMTAANAATLSGLYEEDRQRYGGGMLQRAAPAKKDVDEMDVTSEGSLTPPASVMNAGSKKGKGKAPPKDSVIDPALSAASDTARSEAKEEDREQIWVQNMRLIEWMREIIKKRLESGDYERDEGARAETTGEDAEMTGTAGVKDKTDQEQLYPVLKHVAEDACALRLVGCRHYYDVGVDISRLLLLVGCRHCYDVDGISAVSSYSSAAATNTTSTTSTASATSITGSNATPQLSQREPSFLLPNPQLEAAISTPVPDLASTLTTPESHWTPTTRPRTSTIGRLQERAERLWQQQHSRHSTRLLGSNHAFPASDTAVDDANAATTGNFATSLPDLPPLPSLELIFPPSDPASTSADVEVQRWRSDRDRLRHILASQGGRERWERQRRLSERARERERREIDTHPRRELERALQNYRMARHTFRSGRNGSAAATSDIGPGALDLARDLGLNTLYDSTSDAVIASDLPLSADALPRPAKSSWLQPGMTWHGLQSTDREPTRSASTLLSSVLRRIRPRDSIGRIMSRRGYTNDPWARDGYRSLAPIPVDAADRYLLHMMGDESALAELADSAIDAHPLIAPERSAPAGADVGDHWPVTVVLHEVDWNNMTVKGTMRACQIPDKTGPAEGQDEGKSMESFFDGEIVDFDNNTLLSDGTKFEYKVGGVDVDARYWARLGPFKREIDKEAALLEGSVAKKWDEKSKYHSWLDKDDSVLSSQQRQRRETAAEEAMARALGSERWLREKLANEWVLMRWKEKCFVDPIMLPSDSKFAHPASTSSNHPSASSNYPSASSTYPSTSTTLLGDRAQAQWGLTISGFYYIALHRQTGCIDGLYYDPGSQPYQSLRMAPEGCQLRDEIQEASSSSTPRNSISFTHGAKELDGIGLKKWFPAVDFR
ncbi:hypothetical protein DV737_g4414, partial [Chaetothyriales sp. CBS 132003]